MTILQEKWLQGWKHWEVPRRGKEALQMYKERRGRWQSFRIQSVTFWFECVRACVRVCVCVWVSETCFLLVLLDLFRFGKLTAPRWDTSMAFYSHGSLERCTNWKSSSSCCPPSLTFISTSAFPLIASLLLTVLLLFAHEEYKNLLIFELVHEPFNHEGCIRDKPQCFCFYYNRSKSKTPQKAIIQKYKS